MSRPFPLLRNNGNFRLRLLPAALLALLLCGSTAGPLTARAAAADPPRGPIRAPELEGGAGWLNTAGPIRLQDLRGKFVLLDFWTLC